MVSLSILTFWISSAFLRGGMAGMPATDPEIARVAEEYRAAVLAHDAARAAAVFSEDGVEMPPGHPPVRGRAAIESYYRECFAGPCRLAGFELSPMDVSVAGGVAYNAGTSRWTIPRPGSAPIECSGKYLVVLRREAGRWKVAYAMHNGDAPMPGMGDR